MANTRNLQRTVLRLFSNMGEPLHEEPSVTSFKRGGRKGDEIGTKILAEIPDIMVLPRGKIFSTFNEKHMNVAMKVINLLRTLEEDDLQNALVYLRQNINEEMFVYATSVWLTQQPRFELPPIEEILPEKFIPMNLISEQIMKRGLHGTSQEPDIIDLDFPEAEPDDELRLAYWREDIGLNAHHWHWHVVYPKEWVFEDGTMKDRKGGLFYYMHQQMVARYDCERLCLDFPRVIPLENWNEPIPEGYDSHLTNKISGKNYASRPPNMYLRDTADVTIKQLHTSYENINRDIEREIFISVDSERILLNTEKGIDIVGDALEATSISVNRSFYGNLHNDGHQVISLIHNVEGKAEDEIELGVMSSVETAMRDPLFYRWHKFIDNLFQKHKRTLCPYLPEELTFPPIFVNSVRVQGEISEAPNIIKTFWGIRTIDLKRSVFSNRDLPKAVRISHLQHENFLWVIEVENRSYRNKQGTVRIFMAPKLDENHEPFSPNDQRHLMIEMDKFEYTFKPGINWIERRSEDSNVTQAYWKSYSELVKESESDDFTTEQSSFCKCGLPNNLLVPRGKPEGMCFETFAMVTNAFEDRVEGGYQACADAASYCGVLNEVYPDQKPMGFPFDRVIIAENWYDFQTCNMGFGDVRIHFMDGNYDDVDEYYEPMDRFPYKPCDRRFPHNEWNPCNTRNPCNIWNPRNNRNPYDTGNRCETWNSRDHRNPCRTGNHYEIGNRRENRNPCYPGKPHGNHNYN